MKPQRENWSTKLGVVLAVAGSAVGLGNFLRFPAKVTLNGGGAFMIPYFVALLLLGIPLMWTEWALGRFGGAHGHGTAPGILHKVTRRPYASFFGIFALVGPFLILTYYTYIESWTLAYAWFAFSGQLLEDATQDGMKKFLAVYQGITSGESPGLSSAYIFFVITFIINMTIVHRGIQGGIEKFNKIAMPLLVLLATFLMIRVLSLGTPDPSQPELSINNALGFIWNADLNALSSAKVWLEAAGQVFFTLGVGIGVILTYASYTKKDDDVVLSGLVASSTNEFCEVILGGSIVIPAAFVFFGAAGAVAIAEGGLFNMSFVSMPLIFAKLPFGSFFCGLWFLLLFVAAVTSVVSLLQPGIAFLCDELKLSRGKAVSIIGLILFICCQPLIFFIGRGVIDEIDFWGGTFFLVIFALIEVVAFMWVFGGERAWNEINRGAYIKLPRVFYVILKYVTPVYILILLVSWSWQQLGPVLRMEGVPEENKIYLWGVRVFVVALLVVACALIARMNRRMPPLGEDYET
ncbi:MAG: sodium-dependent transporter [Deltaproteobacteria bacterium]|nr:sodium-dependent transporter [Deltaproteobacteria bacterium]